METSELISASLTVSRKLIKQTFYQYIGPLFGMGFLVFNVLGFLVFRLRLYHFFRTIFVIYVTNMLIFPILLFVGVISRRIIANSWRFERQDVAMLGGATALLLVFVYATLLEPSLLQVETIDIVSDKVTAPFTILHISDIQSGMVGRYEGRVFRQIQQLQPDLIIHTGDLLHSYFFMDDEQEHAKMAQLLRSLDPPYGIYNAIGDIDWRLTSGVFDQQAGIQTLQNEAWALSIHGTPVHLLGLSLASSRRGNRELVEQWHRRSDDRSFTLLFGHAPDYVLDILDLDIDLCLAGHTHGGQIRIPFVGPLVTLSRVPKEWAIGFRRLDNLRLNVSAGIGAEHASQLPPIRINCPPTMTLFTILPSQ